MALVQTQESKWFDYIALTTDIVENKIAGASQVGGIVYITDNGTYKVILPDLTLAAFKQPVVV